MWGWVALTALFAVWVYWPRFIDRIRDTNERTPDDHDTDGPAPT